MVTTSATTPMRLSMATRPAELNSWSSTTRALTAGGMANETSARNSRGRDDSERRAGQVQTEVEKGAAANFALNHRRAAHAFGQQAADRQTQARPADVFRTGCRPALEFGEEFGLLGEGNSRALVRNREDHLMERRGQRNRPGRNRHPPAPGVVQGVADVVEQDLADAVLVADQHRRAPVPSIDRFDRECGRQSFFS